MSYGVVRVQKFTAGSVKGIEIHDRREKDKSHTNPDIDWSKVDKNYDLHPIQNENFRQAINERISQLNLTKSVRKDAVVMVQVLVTSDSLFFDNMLYRDSTANFDSELMRDTGNNDTTKDFFQKAYAFLSDRYGKENIVSATVHMDERTPHMHFNFVPVTADGRLSAKSILTKKTLTEQQDAFYQKVGKEFGLLRGEPKESGKRRIHLETSEYKAEMNAVAELRHENYSLSNELAVLRQNVLEARLNVSKAQDDINHLEQQKNEIRGEIEPLTRYKKALEDEIVNLQEKRNTITSKLDGHKSDMEIMRLQKENTALKHENSVLKRLLNGVVDKIKAHAPQVYNAVIEPLFNRQQSQKIQDRESR